LETPTGRVDGDQLALNRGEDRAQSFPAVIDLMSQNFLAFEAIEKFDHVNPGDLTYRLYYRAHDFRCHAMIAGA
jgi:hypothetical protein